MWSLLELQQRCDAIERAKADVPELETHFSVNKPPPRARRKAKAGGAGDVADSAGAAGILEARRSQNVCITLATMKVGAGAVVDAVAAADTGAKCYSFEFKTLSLCHSSTDVLQPDVVQVP